MINGYKNQVRLEGTIAKVGNFVIKRDGSRMVRFVLITMYDHFDSVKAIYHQCYAYEDLAEYTGDKLKIGQKVAVRGQLNYSNREAILEEQKVNQMDYRKAEIICDSIKIKKQPSTRASDVMKERIDNENGYKLNKEQKVKWVLERVPELGKVFQE